MMIGSLTMLIQYIEKMKRACGNFTWQYSSLIGMKADLEDGDDIESAYAALNKSYHEIAAKEWQSIRIA
ncbi:MAG: hypothetical protein H6765_02925 [Candidatus Peribacteria bacterium]|nr:MAG: hypothetical protein H6765_02925 [Candidatus Peribacteria bacterium]